MPCVRPQRFVHVVYRTRRFQALLDWYAAVFNAQVRHQNPALAFLSYDDEHHRFAFVNLAVLQPEGTEMDRRGAVGNVLDADRREAQPVWQSVFRMR